MTLRSFLQAGDDFAHHLTIHHTIEERHIFPVLAKKMPAFAKELEHKTETQGGRSQVSVSEHPDRAAKDQLEPKSKAISSSGASDFEGCLEWLP